MPLKAAQQPEGIDKSGIRVDFNAIIDVRPNSPIAAEISFGSLTGWGISSLAQHPKYLLSRHNSETFYRNNARTRGSLAIRR
jgi:hypothetical protein